MYRAHTAWIALAWLGACSLGACSQRIEVLGASEPREREPDGGQEDASVPDDAGEIEDASMRMDSGSRDPDASVPDDAGEIEDAMVPMDLCGSCAPEQLCAVDQCTSALGVLSLDAHLTHTCAVRDARAYCWGNNDEGQLGVGDQDNRDAPARIGLDNDWLSLSTGERHTCGLRAPGILYCWGQNHVGQLGLGDTEPRLSPERASGNALWRAVECGGNSCCAIDQSDSLHCWGDNREGKVGQPEPTGPDAVVPTRVDESNWRKLTVGQGHVCAIRDSGELYCWGRNSTVELGIGPDPIQVRGPIRVGTWNDWTDVTSSQHSTCAIRLQKLFCWGLDTHHELGGAVIDERVAMPRLVGSDADWASVHAGWFHTCARKLDGSLYCWGRAIEGQLGQGGGETPIQMATRVEGAPGFTTAALGSFHSCAVTTEGALQCWGENDTGQLGTGDTERRYEIATIP
jgi:alpha-tubulin suppressor-like RCC1 family protein